MTNNFLRQYIPIVFFTLLLGVGYEFSFNNPSLGFYTVMSGSMEPKIKTGSLIVTSKKESYEIGDIVTFSSPKSSEIVSHEVSDVLTKDGRNVYLTKGNSNATTDPYVLDEDRILGEVSFVLPYFGYLLTFIKSELGLLLVVYIPAVFVLKKEVFFLWGTFSRKRLAR